MYAPPGNVQPLNVFDQPVGAPVQRIRQGPGLFPERKLGEIAIHKVESFRYNVVYFKQKGMEELPLNSKVTIRHPELVAIDGADGKIYFGGKTQWLPEEMRQLRGGAVAAAEMISYLAATRDDLGDLYPPRTRRTQAEFETLMERVWEAIAPGDGAPLTLSGFVDGLNAFAKRAGHQLVFNELDIRGHRPSADRCQGFIDDAMVRDTPVAFLNRIHGEDGEILRNWSLIVGQVGNRVILADDGVQRPIDFRLWHDTTSLGGGLVFAMRNPL